VTDGGWLPSLTRRILGGRGELESGEMPKFVGILNVGYGHDHKGVRWEGVELISTRPASWVFKVGGARSLSTAVRSLCVLVTAGLAGYWLRQSLEDRPLRHGQRSHAQGRSDEARFCLRGRIRSCRRSEENREAVRNNWRHGWELGPDLDMVASSVAGSGRIL
jgi:hypothetical protein